MKVNKTSKKQIAPRRIFSETIKRQVVKDIEQGKCTVNEASLELQVSYVSVYRWIYLYSRYLQKNKTMVLQDTSEAYRTKELEAQIKELQAALGRKQLEVDLLNKIIEKASEAYGSDLKKNLSGQLSSGIERIKGVSKDTK